MEMIHKLLRYLYYLNTKHVSYLCEKDNNIEPCTDSYQTVIGAERCVLYSS